MTPTTYAVFKAFLRDDIFSINQYALASLSLGETYTVDASGVGDLTVEDWGRGITSFQNGAGDTFHGRLMYKQVPASNQSSTGEFFVTRPSRRCTQPQSLSSNRMRQVWSSRSMTVMGP